MDRKCTTLTFGSSYISESTSDHLLKKKVSKASDEIHQSISEANFYFKNMNIERIKEVLSSSPSDRKDFEIRMVMDWLKTKVNMFKTLKDNILINLVKECFTVTREEHEMVIREGDIGDCMYILMSGYLHIYRRRDYVESDEGKKQSRREGPVGDVSNKFYPDRSPLGEDIIVLNAPGTVFGEVALIEDCPRTASIVADSPAVLLLVERDLYNRTVRSVIEAEFQTKLNFINNEPLFQHWNIKFKNQLAMSLELVNYDYQSVVVRQGQKVGALFFILQGEVLLSTCPEQHSLQYPKLQTPGTTTDSDGKSRVTRKSVDIAFLDGRGAVKSSVLGDVECLGGLDTYSYTATAAQVTLALRLSIKNFDRLIAKRTPQVVCRMRGNARRRVETWLHRTGDQVPLLRIARQRLQPDSQCIALGHTDGAVTNDNNPCSKPKGRSVVKSGGKFVLPKWGPLVDQTGPGTVFHYIRIKEKLRQKAKQGLQRGAVKVAPQQAVDDDLGQSESVPNNNFSVFQINDAFDTQTSESALSCLESKMREFLDDTPKSSSPKLHVVKLARYNPENDRPLPKGGYVIMLRPRSLFGVRAGYISSTGKSQAFPKILKTHRHAAGNSKFPIQICETISPLNNIDNIDSVHRNLTMYRA